MKNIAVSVILLNILFINLAAGSTELKIIPTLHLWDDSTGFGNLISLEFSRPFGIKDGNFYIEADAGIFWVGLGQFQFMNYLLGAGAGYHWYPFAGIPFSFSPSITIGMGFGHRFDQTGQSELQMNFTVIPIITAEYSFKGGIQAGLYTGPDFSINGNNALLKWMAGVSVGIMIDGVHGEVAEKKEDQSVLLAKDLNSVLADSKIGLDNSQADKLTLNLPDISFEVNSDKINPKLKSLLEKIVGQIVKYAGIYVFIEGHTDNSGQAKNNQILSESRAKKVADLFLQLGFPKNQLFYAGYGETKPLFPNDTPENKAKNRCVIIQIVWDYMGNQAP